MTIITQKLKSKRGASLILAMVFMLMCLFVGGSVLAAATANGGRVADLTSNQQTYLSQRSAALLMADMLEGDDTPLQLTIKKVETTGKNAAGETTVSTTVTYSLPTLAQGENYSTLQQVLVENAVRKYQSGRVSGATEVYDNFAFTKNNGTPYDPSTHHLYSSSAGTFAVTVTKEDGVTSLEQLTASFTSPDPSEATDLESKYFDLYIDFGTNSQISLYVKATYSEGTPVKVTQNGVTTTTTTTVIRWDDPVIEKGGFSS